MVPMQLDFLMVRTCWWTRRNYKIIKFIKKRKLCIMPNLPQQTYLSLKMKRFHLFTHFLQKRWQSKLLLTPVTPHWPRSILCLRLFHQHPPLLFTINCHIWWRHESEWGELGWLSLRWSKTFFLSKRSIEKF